MTHWGQSLLCRIQTVLDVSGNGSVALLQGRMASLLGSARMPPSFAPGWNVKEGHPTAACVTAPPSWAQSLPNSLCSFLATVGELTWTEGLPGSLGGENQNHFPPCHVCKCKGALAGPVRSEPESPGTPGIHAQVTVNGDSRPYLFRHLHSCTRTCRVQGSACSTCFRRPFNTDTESFPSPFF